MKMLACDTSVAVPLIVSTHVAHSAVRDFLGPRPVALTAHSLAETYSVLTRLPGDARLSGSDAARLLTTRFPTVLVIPEDQQRALANTLAVAGIFGGAVYDALVALAAGAAGFAVASRDARAAATYQALRVPYELAT